MQNRTKISLLKKLADAINEVYPTNEPPQVWGPNEGPSMGHPVIGWEGLYEWTMISCGSSLFAGEMDDYSKPTEAPIQKVMDEIKACGGCVEADTNVHLSIW